MRRIRRNYRTREQNILKIKIWLKKYQGRILILIICKIHEKLRICIFKFLEKKRRNARNSKFKIKYRLSHVWLFKVYFIAFFSLFKLILIYFFCC